MAAAVGPCGEAVQVEAEVVTGEAEDVSAEHGRHLSSLVVGAVGKGGSDPVAEDAVDVRVGVAEGLFPEALTGGYVRRKNCHSEGVVEAVEDVGGEGGDVVGVSLAELADRPEAPGDAHAFHAGTVGGLHVHGRISHHEHVGLGCGAGVEDAEDDGWVGLGGTSLCLPAHGHKGNVGEVVADDLLHGGLVLVACHGHVDAAVHQLAQQLGDAFVWLCLVAVVLVVVLSKVFEELVDGLLVGIDLGTLYELAHSVADHEAEGGHGVGGIPHLLQGVVDGVAEVGDGVEQGAVQVEDDKFFHSFFRLERITHGEVERAVAPPAWVDEGPGLGSLGRIVGLHAQVEAEQEVGEVHAQTEAVAGRYLLVERIEVEHSSGLVLVVVDRPDVTGVYECSEFEHPEELGSVFHAGEHVDVTALVHEVGDEVSAAV